MPPFEPTAVLVLASPNSAAPPLEIPPPPGTQNQGPSSVLIIVAALLGLALAIILLWCACWRRRRRFPQKVQQRKHRPRQRLQTEVTIVCPAPSRSRTGWRSSYRRDPVRVTYLSRLRSSPGTSLSGVEIRPKVKVPARSYTKTYKAMGYQDRNAAGAHSSRPDGRGAHHASHGIHRRGRSREAPLGRRAMRSLALNDGREADGGGHSSVYQSPRVESHSSSSSSSSLRHS